MPSITNAMSLTTLGDDGFPRARVVLLKDFSEEGFVFFTNYKSEKGKSLLKHPKLDCHFIGPVWSDKSSLKEKPKN